MKHPYKIPQLFHGLAFSAIALALFAAPAAHAATPVALQVAVTVANQTGSAVTLDSPKLNAKPTLKLIVTQFWTGTYNNHPVGVRYNTTLQKWQIVNEDGATMPVGANFNVLVPTSAKRVIASAANSYFDRTFFTLQKGNDKALLLETHVTNPFSKLGEVSLVKNVGIYFIPTVVTKPVPPTAGKWSVYNEDLSTPAAVGYNIADVTTDGGRGALRSFLFVATTANIAAANAGGIAAEITNPLTDGKAGAVLSVNHVYNAVSTTTLNHPIGIDFIGNKWRIFTEDQTALSDNTAFVVNVQPAVTP